MEKKPTDSYKLSSAQTTLARGGAAIQIIVGVIALVLIAKFGDGERFWFSYLTGFMFWCAISLGALAIVMIHYLVRAKWSVVIRRIAENLSLNFIVSVALFIPFAIGGGVDALYGHWIHSEHNIKEIERVFEEELKSQDLASNPVAQDYIQKAAIVFGPRNDDYINRRKYEALDYIFKAEEAGYSLMKHNVEIYEHHGAGHDDHSEGHAEKDTHGEPHEEVHSPIGMMPIAAAGGTTKVSKTLKQLVDSTDAILLKKVEYLNLKDFYTRSIIILVIWAGLAIFFSYHSSKQDKDNELYHTRWMNRFSPVACFLGMLSLSFAAFDWIMSIESHWFSTMFGVYYFAGSMLCMFALIYIITFKLRMFGRLRNTITREHDHDLGKYMLGFTIFWAYIAYSQFMLIAYANIPEETFWFQKRWEGTWKCVTYFLIFFKFVIPFLLLISRHPKRSDKKPFKYMLFPIACLIVLMHAIDVYWMIQPAAPGTTNIAGALTTDVVVFLGITFLFSGFFLYNLARRALVPVNDPWLEDSINFENH